MIIDSNYFVEIHQVLLCVIFVFQTFSIIDFISPTITGLIQQKNVDIDDENSAQISTVAKSMVTHDDPKL